MNLREENDEEGKDVKERINIDPPSTIKTEKTDSMAMKTI